MAVKMNELIKTKPEEDMDANTRAILLDHDRAITALKQKYNNHDQKIDSHDQMIEELRANDIEIMKTLAKSATHDDIQDVHLKIDDAVNGLLKDALNAVPANAANQIAKQGNLWLAVAAIVALCALIAAIVTHHV